jgi:hypothetical protein
MIHPLLAQSTRAQHRADAVPLQMKRYDTTPANLQNEFTAAVKLLPIADQLTLLELLPRKQVRVTGIEL